MDLNVHITRPCVWQAIDLLSTCQVMAPGALLLPGAPLAHLPTALCEAFVLSLEGGAQKVLGMQNPIYQSFLAVFVLF